MDGFTEEELLTYLEMARVAFADADLFDYMADKLDISDEEMSRLSEKLSEYLETTNG